MRVIALFGWCSVATLLWGQHTEKCAASLLAHRQAEVFTLLVRDVSAFERRLLVVAPSAHIRQRYTPAGVVVLQCAADTFKERILPMPEVLFADTGPGEGYAERAVPGHDLSVNDILAVLTEQPELDGSGTTVSIKEWRFDSTDVDLRGRVLLGSHSAPQTTVHATLVATLIAGAGNSDPQARGVARGAYVLSSSFLGLLPDNDYDTWNVGVQAHAYGTEIENYYSPSALAYDASTQRHPQLLHVFSAGNAGDQKAPSGLYSGLEGHANLTGSFKMAKNALVVGATDARYRVQPFSSRGPAHDGRVKPDLVAYGPNGSSEAAALVAGAAAVVRQCLWERRGFWPGSDLVRAVLLAACDDLPPDGPDFSSGYGSLNLRRAVAVAQKGALWCDTLFSGRSVEFILDIPAGTHRLRAALCWNDPPALPQASTALVNDLDLTLVAPDGAIWSPWVLSHYPHPDSLRLPARRGIDTLNTTELVDLPAPRPGTYRLRVSARQTEPGPQPFALAVHLAPSQTFEWIDPVAGRHALRAETFYLRWQQTYTEKYGALHWRRWPDGSWLSIADSVLLLDGYWPWTLPDTTTAAQVRMQTGSDEWLSDVFLIAPPLRVKVEVNCPDSVLLSWPSIGAQAQYRLWGLGTRYLEPLLLTTDTAVVLPKSLFSQSHFAVSAQVSGVETPPGPAPHLDQQGAGCYLNTFLAYLDESRPAVILSLTLGSLRGVEAVFVEKWLDDRWQILHVLSASALHYEVEDINLVSGKNTYRVRIRMLNGATLDGEPVSVYYAGAKGALVYPNPATPAQRLTVLVSAEHLPAQWQLFDALGRWMTTIAVEETSTAVTIPHLPPGHYTWMLAAHGSWVERGVMVVKPY